MNSTAPSLVGMTHTYTGRVSTTKGVGFQNKGVSRTLFLYPNVAELPAELFACKISQSTNPALQGKIVFKYLSFRFEPTAAFSAVVPASITLATDLAEVKNIVMASLANIPTVETSLQIKLYGAWKNIATATGDVVLYNDNAPELQNPNAKLNGEPPYYIKKDAIITVALKGMSSPQGNDFIASELSTTAPSSQIFQMRGASGAIWDGTDGTSTPVAQPTATAPTTASTAPAGTPAGAPVW